MHLTHLNRPTAVSVGCVVGGIVAAGPGVTLGLRVCAGNGDGDGVVSGCGVTAVTADAVTVAATSTGAAVQAPSSRQAMTASTTGGIPFLMCAV